jgi:hypothetical protein
MLLFCLLTVEGSLAFDLSITTFVISLFAFAVSRGESILIVQLGVFQAVEGIMVVATSYTFPVGFL